LFDRVCGDEFVDRAPRLFEIESRWNASGFSVIHQPVPVAIEGKWFAVIDSQRREHAPSIEQSCRRRRDPRFPCVDDPVVLVDETMHASVLKSIET
jgi:hypothetical protein